jgi:ribokinase
MAIFNLGSINADYFYAVPHIPHPGETLEATHMSRGLGGKGANMSVAAVRAGSDVFHIGAVGADGDWAKSRLAEYGVNTKHITSAISATGHAIITVAADGENSIVIFPGANSEITADQIEKALKNADQADTLVLQNETNNQALCAKLAFDLGLRIVYAAAPFSAKAVQAVLPYVDVLVLNEVEAAQLNRATGSAPSQLPVRNVIVTLGEDGCRWHDNASQTTTDYPAPSVTPVDTTGAGDTFTGYLLAGLDQGREMPEAIRLATQAAALMVQRHGTADVIPTLDEVTASF